MTKIIGFLITKGKKDINIDFFNVGIQPIELTHLNYSIYLWGIGDIENYKIYEKYSLSFPLHVNLLDRNVLISFENEKILLENDWLGAIPVFYNTSEQIVSTISNFCIRNKTIHNEGLANFCEFGYSVFEQTIFEDVKFMRYYSKLIISDTDIHIEYKNDPVLEKRIFDTETTTVEVIQKMQEYVANIENNSTGEIVLPTSGGYDSRILNYLVKDKNRIRSFTYGISADQSKSSEVVHAKKISEIYNTQWEQIELKEFHNYIDNWFSIYGISTHLHGMYHIEFYSKILDKHKFKNPTFLSGIIGDAWAELGKFKNIHNYQDIINLGYTHGMNIDLKYLQTNSANAIKEKAFLENKEHLQNDKIKSIFAMRTKLILISYLTQIPEYFGMLVWTPFLNFEIVKATLNLPDEKRKNRIWERDFFSSVSLNLEDMSLSCVRSNCLDYETLKNAKLEYVNVDLMKQYFKEEKIIEINKMIQYKNQNELIKKVKNYLFSLLKIGGVLRLIGIKNQELGNLYEYYFIKAVEKGLVLNES